MSASERSTERTDRRRIVVIGAALAIVALLITVVAVTGALGGRGASGDADAATPAASATTDAAPSSGFAAGGLQDPAVNSAPAASVTTPVSVRIARIGVDSSLESLAIDAAGQLAAPVDWNTAGWYSAGVTPGQIGPAIIAGHIDSPTAPAVFYRLAELVPGDEVQVVMSDGQTLVFDVTGSVQSAKSTFPTDEVYSNVPRPELRLITCAGAFDSSIGHYTDNLIVFASLRS